MTEGFTRWDDDSLSNDLFSLSMQMQDWMGKYELYHLSADDLIRGLGIELKWGDQKPLSPLELSSKDFIDISRDNPLYYHVLVAPDECLRDLSDCKSALFEEKVYVNEWGLEYIWKITD